MLILQSLASCWLNPGVQSVLSNIGLTEAAGSESMLTGQQLSQALVVRNSTRSATSQTVATGVDLDEQSTIFSENGETGSMDVALLAKPNNDVVLNLESSDTTEFLLSLDGGETVSEIVSITFNKKNWDAYQSVTLVGQDDTLVDGDQSVELTVSVDKSTTFDTSGYADLASLDVSVTIQDDDSAGLTISQSSITTSEYGTTASFTVRPTAGPSSGKTIDATIESQDITEGTVDRTGLTWDESDWQTAKTIIVTGVDDDLIDGNQNYTLLIDPSGSTDSSYQALSVKSVAVQNSDNDTPGFTISKTTLSVDESGGTDSFTIRPNTQPASGNVIHVDITSGDPEEALVDVSSITWTNSSWETEQTVIVSGQNDDVSDGNQTFDITIDSSSSTESTYLSMSAQVVSVTNSDNDTAGVTITPATTTFTENGGMGSFDVVLNTEPDGNVVIIVTSGDTGEVLVSTNGGSTTANSVSLTFTTSDWETEQTVTLVGQNDDVDDGNKSVTITNSISGSVTTDTTGYDGVTVASVSTTIQDDDTAGVTITPATTAFSENGGTGSFDVVLNTEPDGNVVITATSGDTGEVLVSKNGGSTTANSVTLTFTTSDWDTIQTVTLVGQNDDVDDGNRSVTITNAIHTSATTDTTGYDGVSVANVSTTIQDDDTAGVTVTVGTTAFSENGGRGDFDVVLNTEPDGNVVITITSGDPGEVLVSKNGGSTTANSVSLTFTASDWETVQTVTLVGHNDDLDDNNQTVTITNAINTSATTDTTGYDGVSVANVTTTIQDDDTAEVTVTPGTTILSENGGRGDFDVVLNTEPDGNVVITVTSGDPGEVLVSKNGGSTTANSVSLTFTASDWETVQTVTLVGKNDDMDDGNQTVTITNSINTSATTDTTGYDGVTVANVSTTIQDDDTAGITVTPGTTAFSENGGTGDFDVVLNTEPDGDVVIYVSTGDSGEVVLSKDGGSTTANNLSLTFTNTDWETVQTVTLVGKDEDVDDSDKVVTITNSVSVGSTMDTTGYKSLTPDNVTVTVQDDDAAGFTYTGTPVTTVENGSSQSFTIRPSTQPAFGEIVRVDLNSEDTGEATVTPPYIIWTDSSWTHAETVTVTPVDDDIADGDQTFDITISPDDSTDSVYNSMDDQIVSVTNQDDGDFAFVTVNVSSLELGTGMIVNLAEGSENKTFTGSESKSFTTPLVYGSTYTVTIGTEPVPYEYCYTSNGSGTIVNGNVTVDFHCISPDDYSPKIWLKSDDLPTSGSVAGWPDQSGYGRDAIQGNTNNQPTIVPDSINGYSVVRFDGINDYMMGPSFEFTQTSILWVSRFYNAGSDNDGIFSFYPTSGQDWNTVDSLSISIPYSGTTNFKLERQVGGNGLLTAQVSNSTGVHQASVLFGSGSGSIYLDGASGPSDSYDDLSSLNPAGYIMGTRWLGSPTTTYTSQIDFAEFLILGTKLSDTSRRELECYLKFKYNLSSLSNSFCP